MQNSPNSLFVSKLEKESSEHDSRVVPTQVLKIDLLSHLYDILEVNPIEETISPKQGRIATNIIQKTNKGELLIRIYPKNMPYKLETGNVNFEIEALNHFASKGINVPAPLLLGDKLFIVTEDQIIFCYFCIKGEGIEQSTLSVELAKEMGKFLNNILPVAAEYKGVEPLTNSFDYILEIASKIEEKYLDLRQMDTWISMKNMAQNNMDLLDGTPTGIVHADYFFENILIDDSKHVVGLIDFGDAYHTHLLHDVVIGAMEASVLSDESWNLDMFKAFLIETESFLKESKISFKQFFETLKVNCLRFAVYTIPFTVQEGKQIIENHYINRYIKLLDEEFEKELNSLYIECSHKHDEDRLDLKLSGDVEHVT